MGSHGRIFNKLNAAVHLMSTSSKQFLTKKEKIDKRKYYCFRFIDEDRLNGRCEITSLPTEFSSFTDWDTSVAPLFNVYIKHSYCPEARYLIQPSTTKPPSVAGRILAPSPFLSLSGPSLDFYPSGSHYLQNSIFPDSRNKLYFKQNQQRGKWEFRVFKSNEGFHTRILRCNLLHFQCLPDRLSRVSKSIPPFPIFY